jgi:hypothetical protein
MTKSFDKLRTSGLVLLCLPLAAGGLGLAVHATTRVRTLEVELTAASREIGDAGASFLETLKGEHAERQRLAFDRRRAVALALAEARRDRLLGVLGAAAAALAAGGLVLLGRIAAEVEADRQHVSGG